MPEKISLQDPLDKSTISIEEALNQRRSVREYRDGCLTLRQASQLLWAAQGVTHPNGYRTSPSAGALYPLEVYLLAGEVEGLGSGVYRYLPQEHVLLLKASGDHRQAVCDAALDQDMILNAPASIIISAVFGRTSMKYGSRAEQYVYMEVGSAAQNVYLQVESLGLSTVIIGAFHDGQMKKTLDLPGDEQPLAVLPVGNT